MIGTKKNQRGFTIFEMSVVMVLFMFTVGTVVTIFISIVQHQRRVLEDQQFINQVSYASEYLSRGLRLSVKDASGGCLQYGGQSYPGAIYLLTHYNVTSEFYEGVTFLTYDGICHQVYADEGGSLLEIRDGSDPAPILSGQFTVNNIKFIINGDKTKTTALQSDYAQPRLTFVLRLKSRASSSLQQDKVIQTTVSQRNLNIP